MPRTHMTTIEQRATDGGPLTGFRATCSCGWEGDTFHIRRDAEDQASKHERLAPIADAGETHP
jgi:hypothetical protein